MRSTSSLYQLPQITNSFGQRLKECCEACSSPRRWNASEEMRDARSEILVRFSTACLLVIRLAAADSIFRSWPKYLRFALESNHSSRVARKNIGQYLQCDFAFQLRIACPIHLAHSTLAESQGFGTGQNFVPEVR